MSHTKLSEIPATPLQAGMIFHSLAHPKSGVDVEHISISIDEALDVEKLLAAWNETIMLHPSLRTVFEWADSSASKQRILDKSTLQLHRYDWRNLSDNALRLEQFRLQLEDRQKGFALDQHPPLRLHLAAVSDTSYWLLWSFHHALLDGRSFPIVLRDVFDLYDERTQNHPARPFADYCHFIDSFDHSDALDFWRTRLRAVEGTSAIDAPTYLPDGPKTKYRYSPTNAVISRQISLTQSDNLRAFAAQQGLTLHTLMQTAWVLLLHHYTQKDTIVFGSTRANRHGLEHADSMVGLLINTIPFCVSLSPSMTILELLQVIRAEQTRLRDFETTPLTLIQQHSPNPAIPLFDSLMMFDDKTLNSRMREGRSAQPATRQFEYEGQTNFPLSWIIYGEQEISIRLEYQFERYSDSFCETLLSQFETLLLGLNANTERAAVEVPYLTSRELQRFEEWNNSSRSYPSGSSLHGLFEKQVDKSPAAIATVYNGEALSYVEFNARANRLAHFLRENGVGPDQLVGVIAERSHEMLIALYAILKAGGAYVPLDPEFPAERLAFMLEDSGVEILLTQTHVRNRIPDTDAQIVELNDSTVWQQYPTTNPEHNTSERDLAYMLYTSGSTGKPKGAMNEHRGIVNRLLWMQEAFALDSSDVVLQKTPYTFDVSVWELFWPLQVGAKLVIADPGGHKDTDYLASTITSEKITTLHFVPSMLQLFVEEPKITECGSLRRIICSGEALPKELQNKVFSKLPGTELHNLYGPTEAAIDVSWWQCEADSQLPFVPIGKTIANTQLHILDTQLNPVPVGVAGELHIGGVQVARGYRNRPELTAERFIDNPFDPKFKLYKTGDLVRYMPDGNIEYLGRLDFQVKIRGLRIELGEIETVVNKHSSVNEVVVTAHKSASGEYQLVAYVVGQHINIDDVKRHAGAFLADYMVPVHWLVLDSFPLNSSGKIDRKRLPAPENQATRSSVLVKPENDAEQTILGLWQELLGTKAIGIDDTFFDVGGSSLLVIRLSNQLSETYGVKVAVQTLLRETTVRKQARYLSKPSQAVDQSLTTATTLASQQKSARQRRRRPGARG